MGLDTKMPIMDSKKVILKSLEEITLLQKSAQLVSKTLGMLAKEIKPGIDTLYLDKIAEEFIRDHKGVPGFLGMYDFPNTLCVSTNNEVVHGIPNKKPLEDGDIVSIDCGVLVPKTSFLFKSSPMVSTSINTISPSSLCAKSVIPTNAVLPSILIHS